MAEKYNEAVSQILGDPGDDAVDRLVPLIYDDLRKMARRSLRAEHPGHTLNTTALAHEAYLRIADVKNVSEHGQRYFFGAVARAMRRILVESARRRQRQKRGGDRRRVTLDTSHLAVPSDCELIELDEVLKQLDAVAPRQARVVECRFFGGMNVSETAQLLGISERTVKNDWSFARSWLYRALQAGESARSPSAES